MSNLVKVVIKIQAFQVNLSILNKNMHPIYHITISAIRLHLTSKIRPFYLTFCNYYHLISPFYMLFGTMHGSGRLYNNGWPFDISFCKFHSASLFCTGPFYKVQLAPFRIPHSALYPNPLS